MPKKKKNRHKKGKIPPKQNKNNIKPKPKEEHRKRNEEKKSKKKKNKYIEDEFKKELSDLGYYIREVKGDGNCLFRSVSDQLENTQNNYDYYRDLCISYMKNHLSEFQPFIEDDKTIEQYIDKMSKDGEWGGNLEIYALSKALEVNFYIYIYQHPLYIVNNFQHPNQNVMLTYHDGEHYNSLRKLEDQQNEEGKSTKTSESEDDDDEEETITKVNDVSKLIEKVEHLNI